MAAAAAQARRLGDAVGKCVAAPGRQGGEGDGRATRPTPVPTDRPPARYAAAGHAQPPRCVRQRLASLYIKLKQAWLERQVAVMGCLMGIGSWASARCSI
eukprot:364536-Chlamydomonas_euryale.AAC.6